MLASLVLAAATTQAHDPSEDMALEPFVHDGVLAGTWTTAGLVRWDGVAWLEVCDNALLGMTDVWLAPDGAFLRAGGPAIEESTDGGCSWSARADVPFPAALTSVGDVLVATTDDTRLGVYVSTDDGDTFVPAAPFPREVTARDIAADGAGTWWVSAATSTNEPVIFVSGTAGASWEEVAPPPTEGLVFLATHGPGPAGGVLLTSTTFGAFTTLWESTPDDTWTNHGVVPLHATHVVCIGSACLATLSGIASLRWDATVGLSSATLVEDGPVGCLRTADDGAVWGCNARGQLALFGRTTDGIVFEQALAGEVIAFRACGAGTEGQAACPLPPIDTGDPPGPDVDPPTNAPVEGDDGGCAGCHAAPWSPAVPFLLVFVGAWAKPGRTRRP